VKLTVPRLIPCALIALAAAVQAQQPVRPQIQTTKVDGTEGVYIFRNGGHQASSSSRTTA
jgi:hypothetical protein